ncbi:MAG: hypothetical protein GY847_16480 [Proteobacteria bacterium]|nr:hypothetical protein [Pseudomonadota bacterium]
MAIELIGDAYFELRLIVGLTLLGVLALIDVIKNPRNPRRLKEYAFLFSVTALAIGYGVIHDLVTYNICSEYFTIGYGLKSAADSFYPEVALLAVKASWSAGLLIGLVILIANNPHKQLPQLDYNSLARYLAGPLTCSIVLAVTFGLVANLLSPIIANQLELSVLRLHNEAGFLTVWGIHIGTYFGGLVGLILSAVLIRKARRTLSVPR